MAERWLLRVTVDEVCINNSHNIHCIFSKEYTRLIGCFWSFYRDTIDFDRTVDFWIKSLLWLTFTSRYAMVCVKATFLLDFNAILCSFVNSCINTEELLRNLLEVVEWVSTKHTPFQIRHLHCWFTLEYGVCNYFYSNGWHRHRLTQLAGK